MMQQRKIDVRGVLVYSCASLISLHFVIEAILLGNQGPGLVSYLTAGPILAFSVFRLLILAIRGK